MPKLEFFSRFLLFHLSTFYWLTIKPARIEWLVSYYSKICKHCICLSEDFASNGKIPWFRWKECNAILRHVVPVKLETCLKLFFLFCSDSTSFTEFSSQPWNFHFKASFNYMHVPVYLKQKFSRPLRFHFTRFFCIIK